MRLAQYSHTVRVYVYQFLKLGLELTMQQLTMQQLTMQQINYAAVYALVPFFGHFNYRF